MISDSAVVCRVDEVFGLGQTKVFLFCCIDNSVGQFAVQEYGHQVFSISEDKVSASTDYYTVLISNHFHECAAEFFSYGCPLEREFGDS